MDIRTMNKIDRGFLPTFLKYNKEQLIGAIVKFISNHDISSFSDELESRKLIKEIGVEKIKQALLEHVVKLEFMSGISNVRFVYDYNDEYINHSIGESELRILDILADSYSKEGINKALRLLETDGVLLLNIVTSFVDYRYAKKKGGLLDTSSLDKEEYQNIINVINDFFEISV